MLAPFRLRTVANECLAEYVVSGSIPISTAILFRNLLQLRTTLATIFFASETFSFPVANLNSIVSSLVFRPFPHLSIICIISEVRAAFIVLASLAVFLVLVRMKHISPLMILLCLR